MARIGNEREITTKGNLWVPFCVGIGGWFGVFLRWTSLILAYFLSRSSIFLGHRTLVKIRRFAGCTKEIGIMKLNGIHIGNTDENLNLKQFKKTQSAKSPLGRLLIALFKKMKWSSLYKVYASFDTGVESFLKITHKDFLCGDSLVIYDDGKTELSVFAVREAIKTHIRIAQQGQRHAIDILQRHVQDLQTALEKIDMDEAEDTIRIDLPWIDPWLISIGKYGTLFVFSENSDSSKTPIYITQAIGGKFIGGTAMVNMSPYKWIQAQSGILRNQQHGIFWAALAIMFAEDNLNINDGVLCCEEVFADKKPLVDTQSDPNKVRKVVLKSTTTTDRIVVEETPQ